jgi:mannosyltransferase OCH1-like enzyme
MYNLGLAHGIPALIMFFSKLKEQKISHPLLDILLNKSINYILSTEQNIKTVGSHFCMNIPVDTKINELSRIGWCYGDLGMPLIPKIIHQIWSDKYKPLPPFFSLLSDTWKEKHPDWQYIYWSEQDMNDFMQSEFPELRSFYDSLFFDIQRWDAVRFLILYKMGGMYADFDYECLENMEPLLDNRTCCIALEPETHCVMYNIPRVLNAALLACTPENFYLEKVIKRVFSEKTMQQDRSDKPMSILHTTGPLMLSDIYENLSIGEKASVCLIPAKYVTPFDCAQIAQVKAGMENDELENCLQEAYAIHYFTNSWVSEVK